MHNISFKKTKFHRPSCLRCQYAADMIHTEQGMLYSIAMKEKEIEFVSKKRTDVTCHPTIRHLHVDFQLSELPLSTIFSLTYKLHTPLLTFAPLLDTCYTFSAIRQHPFPIGITMSKVSGPLLSFSGCGVPKNQACQLIIGLAWKPHFADLFLYTLGLMCAFSSCVADVHFVLQF